MVTTRAAMEARLDEVERRLAEMHGENVRAMANLTTTLTRQIEQLRRDRSSSGSRSRDGDRRRRHQHRRRGVGRRGEGGREDDSRSQRDGESQEESDEDSDPSEARWNGDRRPQRVEVSRKMDLPIFSGADAYGWLVRVERYFRVAQIGPRDRLDLALVAMEGEALTWYEWWEEQTEFHSWRRFKEDLLRRFQPGAAQNPLGPLLDVKQTGSVMQYRRDFELVARSKRNMDPEILMGIFMNGLKREVRAEMRMDEFRNLSEMMDRALELE